MPGKKKTAATAEDRPNDPVSVKDFAEWLLATFDPDLPLHRKDSAGDFPAMRRSSLSGFAQERKLMRYADGQDYTALTTDKAWEERREQFGPDFKAVVVW